MVKFQFCHEDDICRFQLINFPKLNSISVLETQFYDNESTYTIGRNNSKCWVTCSELTMTTLMRTRELASDVTSSCLIQILGF